jgi:photosystem II stability/assembly factor-like uncharacterized protein
VLLRLFALMICLALSHAALAHDPSAWGGTFRSRDGGVTWMPIDAGLFVGGAITVAIDPLDANHLLYATDTRLLRSRNGGRDWKQETSPIFVGPTLAVAFASDAKTVLTATAAGIFASTADADWKAVNIASAASPALAILPGSQPEQFFVVGARGTYRSDDRGQSWMRVGEMLPEAPTAIAIPAGAPGTLVALVQGAVFVSADSGATWQERRNGLPVAHLEMLSSDATAKRVWAGGTNRLFRSDDGGITWASAGEPLPDADTRIRGVYASADGAAIDVSTHRGIYRSTDSGKSWTQLQGNLPVHLEAGALVRDPHDAATVYAPFSLTPYHEIRRRAMEGSNLLSQVDPFSLLGAGAFLILFIVAAVYAVRKLMRISSRSTSTGIQ